MKWEVIYNYSSNMVCTLEISLPLLNLLNKAVTIYCMLCHNKVVIIHQVYIDIIFKQCDIHNYYLAGIYVNTQEADTEYMKFEPTNLYSYL